MSSQNAASDAGNMRLARQTAGDSTPMFGSGQFSTDWPGFQFQVNSTNTVINQLRLATSKSIRQSAIILASFNAVAGLLLAAGIVWDCYRAAKRADPKLKFMSSMYKIIGPMNVFPFVLAIGIMVQGTIFAIEQSKGLDSLLILGCEPISQVMLPAIFIVPYMQFVFGMETALRALRKRAFASFGKWTVSVCVAIVIIALAGTYTLTRFVRAPNFCFASLFWFVQTWRVACFSILVGITGSLVLACVVTFTRLLYSTNAGAVERIAASRMVYYMCIAAITNGVLIPFFASLTFSDNMDVTKLRGQFSMAAMVASNLTALTNGGLYVFLRACHVSNIGRKGYFNVDRQQPRKEVRNSPMTQVYTAQIDLPVSPPRRLFITNQDVEDSGPKTPKGTNAEASKPQDDGGSEVSAPPLAASPPRKTHARKASYSVFPQAQALPQPQQQITKPISRLPAATYTPPTIPPEPKRSPAAQEQDLSILVPPPSLIPGLAITKHQRDSSLGSTATVQIGLRFSNVNDMPPTASYAVPRVAKPRPTSSVYPTDSMVFATGALPSSPPPPMPPPLQIPDRASQRVPSSVWVDPAKQLPPVPLNPSRAKAKKDRDSQMLLSPLVYSPDQPSRSATASPRDRDPRMSPWGGTASSGERPPIETTEWI